MGGSILADPFYPGPIMARYNENRHRYRSGGPVGPDSVYPSVRPRHDMNSRPQKSFWSSLKASAAQGHGQAMPRCINEVRLEMDRVPRVSQSI
jgi:hypothetical protein